MHANQQRCFHTVPRRCEATLQDTRKHGEVISQVLRERRVDEPTTSRHRATTPQTKNEKRTQGICTMGAATVRGLSTVVAATRQRRHPSISAKGECLTLHVLAPRKLQFTRWINKKRWQPFLPCCDHGSQPETQTHAHLVTHFYQPQFVVGCK